MFSEEPDFPETKSLAEETAFMQSIANSLNEKLIKPLSPEKIPFMYEGLKAGFTLEDIQSDWFSRDHISLVNGSIAYGHNQKAIQMSANNIRGLSKKQVKGLAMGFPMELVFHPQYPSIGYEARWRLKAQLDSGISVKKALMLLSLKSWQLTCMDNEDSETPLNIEQVTETWFTPMHALALQGKCASYEDIQGLNVTQVKGLMANLSPEQVRQPWFKSEHLAAIEDGMPYEKICGLSISAVRTLRESDSEVVSFQGAREPFNRPIMFSSSTCSSSTLEPEEKAVNLHMSPGK